MSIPRALSSIVVLLIAGAWVHSFEARADFEGDKEHLNMVIAKYRENLERLKTWKGKARLINRIWRDNSEILVESEIDFAYDARGERYRYNSTALRDVSIVDDMEVPRLTPKHRAALFNKDGYYDLLYVVGSKGLRTANLSEKKRMKAGWGSAMFEPMFFFTDKGNWQDQHLQVLADNFDHPAAIGSVKREGDTITVVRVIDEVSVEKVFSLAMGGNATRITTTEKRPDGSEHVWVNSWDWERVNDVWVPKSASRQERDSAALGERKNHSIEWEQNLVNDPIEEREFSLASLGLRQGDFIFDTRNNTQRVLKGPEFPPGKPRKKKSVGPVQ
jgi:hypothetical protein